MVPEFDFHLGHLKEVFFDFLAANRRSSASYVDLRYCLPPFVEKQATKIDIDFFGNFGGFILPSLLSHF